MKVEKRLGVEAGGKEEKENTTRVSLVWRSVVVCSSETHFGGFGSIAVQLPERVVSSPVSCFLNSALEFKWGPGKYPLGGKIPRPLESGLLSWINPGELYWTGYGSPPPLSF